MGNKDWPIYGLLAVILIVMSLLILILVPVKTVNSTVIDKQWTTWTRLQEDYTTTEIVCDTTTHTDSDGNVKSETVCSPETKHHTRTLDSASLSGGATDPVEYPPDFETRGDLYNSHSGRFVITYRDSAGIVLSNHVYQGQFEGNYVLGLECEIKLNIYNGVVSDDCVANGR